MKKNIAVLSVFALAVSGVAFALPKGWADPYENITRLHFVAKKGDWKNARNWNPQQLPAGFVRAYIHAGCLCTLNSPCEVTESVIVGEMPGETATLSIENGAKAALGTLIVAHQTLSNSQGVVRMQGGELSLGNDKEQQGSLAVGAGRTFSGTGIFEISGGKLRGPIYIGSSVDRTQAGTFSVVGSAPSVSTNAKGRKDLCVNASGVLKFVLDKEGVAPIDARGGRAIFSGGKVMVDGAAYAGGSRRIPLILADRLSENPAVEVVNFPETCKASVFPEIKEKGASEALILKITVSKK